MSVPGAVFFTLSRAIVTFIVCMLFFGMVGTAIGGALGYFLPDYYRGVFRNGNDPNFDPVSVGFGLGLTQGVGGGVAVGVILSILFVVRDVLLRARQPDFSRIHRD